MSDFLKSLKSDLTDRRMLPLVALAGVALLAAAAYAALGGSSSTEPLPSTSSPTRPVGIVVSQAPSNPNRAVAETTNGATVQRKGNARNPFAPLAVASVKVTSSPTKKPASSTPSKKAAPSKGESVGVTPTKPATRKIITRFHVTAQFGVVPPPPAPGAQQLPTQLKTYENLTVDQPLPEKNNAQVVYLGVLLPAGKGAVFALTGEAILHGSATCLPSATQCRAIELLPKQSELLETFDANGNPVTYELKLVSITKTVTTASAAKAHVAVSAPTKAQRELLRRAGVTVLPGLRSSPGSGTVLFVPRRPHSPRAHTAAGHRAPKA
jgi:hypothetical protein